MSRKLGPVECGIWLLCLGSLAAMAGCQTATGLAYNNSGRGYYQRGNYAMARDEFHRATLDDPHNPDYRHNLAMALKKTGDYAGAERVLRQNLTSVSAMHQPTYHSLSQLLVEQNRQAEAQDLLQGWAMAQPYMPESHIEMAWIQREMGNSMGAEQSLRQALQVDPQNASAMAQLGQLYQDNGQTDRAAAMYQRSLASHWQQPQVQSRLKTLADGSGRNIALSRAALMQNSMSIQPARYASGPTMPMAGQPSMTVTTTRPTTEPVVANGPSWSPTSQSTIVTNGEFTVIPSANAPTMASGPQLIPNADPAHVQTDLASEEPLVEAH